MKRLVITADVHGSFNTWMTLKALLEPEDGLAVAGDLFDTRYGNYGSPDFVPEFIKKDLAGLPHSFFYVYGNCDVPAFFPGHDHETVFPAMGKTLFLHHGHARPAFPSDAEIIVQGHTHLCSLEKKGGRIFLNPGSITHPRNGMATYGILDRSGIFIVALKTGMPVVSIAF